MNAWSDARPSMPASVGERRVVQADHPADGAGAVLDARGALDHLDAVGRERVDLGRVLAAPRLPLLLDAVLEDQHAVRVEAADDRLRDRRAGRERGDAVDRLQRLAERLPARGVERLAVEHRHGAVAAPERVVADHLDLAQQGVVRLEADRHRYVAVAQVGDLLHRAVAHERHLDDERVGGEAAQPEPAVGARRHAARVHADGRARQRVARRGLEDEAGERPHRDVVIGDGRLRRERRREAPDGGHAERGEAQEATNHEESGIPVARRRDPAPGRRAAPPIRHAPRRAGSEPTQASGGPRTEVPASPACAASWPWARGVVSGAPPAATVPWLRSAPTGA